VRALVLYAYPPGLPLRPAVDRHLHALDGRGDDLLYHNALEGCPRALGRWRPDAVVLHTTFLCLRWFEDFDAHRTRFAWIAGLDVPKLALPQDEYDHSEVLEDWLRELGATHVYSNFDAARRAPLYPALSGRAEFREALTGYVEETAAGALRTRVRPLDERPYDVVYRATQLPYWFGSHGQLKHELGSAVAERAGAHGLSTDISTRPEDVILGSGWWDFLGSGRVVIGCESGSSVLDRRGELQAQIRRLLALEPELTFEEVSRRLPEGWDSWSFFAVSPRHLEAVLTKTAQVLVEGSYNGVLEPERHYIPLRRDLADLDEVLERIRDVPKLERLAEQAYEDIVLSGRYGYSAFAERLRADAGRTGPRSGRGAYAIAAASSRLRHTLLGNRAREVVANAAALGRLLSLSPEARRLVIAHAQTRSGSVMALVDDLLRLERLRREAAAAAVSIEVGRDHGSPLVLITTRPGDRSGPATEPRWADALRGGASIAWLHGSGAAGLRRFAVLSALGRQRPDEVGAAFHRALSPAGRARAT
jgi:hypothetical protein